MENASNALIMAAGILISIMLISLGTYLFATFGGYSKNINDTLSQTQIEEFNAQFTKYESTPGDETTYCTAYDIVSVINLAKDANEKYEEYRNITTTRPQNANNQNNTYICVNVKGNSTITELSDTTSLNTFIQDNIKIDSATKETKLTKYQCTIIVSNQTKLVKNIRFTKQP